MAKAKKEVKEPPAELEAQMAESLALDERIRGNLAKVEVTNHG